MKDYVLRHDEQSAVCVFGAGGGGGSKKTNQEEVSEVDTLLGAHTSSCSGKSFSLIRRYSLYYDGLFNLTVNFKNVYLCLL